MNYREAEATGTTWRRCQEVHIFNPLNAVPHIRFDEQDVLAMGGRTVADYAGYLTVAFEPGASFALLDPQTGQPTGQTMDHQAMYQALFSLYLHTAAARDAAALTTILTE